MHVLRLPVLLLTTCVAVTAAAQDPIATQQEARRAELQRTGVAAPLTLWPVRLLGRADANVADALGLVLEKSGMPSLETAGATVDAKDLAWEAIPAAFGAHVKENAGKGGVPAATWSLYAELLGTPKSGPKEVRFVVVDASGELVLVDRQTPEDATFRRTAGADPDPLGCVTCVGERLFELAGWKKVAGGVRDGRFAALWEKKSGAPDRKERAAMQQRRAALRDGLAEASFVVFEPVCRQPTEVDGPRFATAVQQALACKHATAVAVAPEVAPSPNQQKRLYDLAAAMKARLQKEPAAAAYALAVDCAFDADGKRGYVNVVVLTKAGELVLAEFQNDQHALFQKFAPKGLADGEKLAVALLQKALR